MFQHDTSTPAEVFAGIDWDGSFHQVCLIDARGQVLRQQRVHHDVAGLNELNRLLCQQDGWLRVAIERAEGLLVEHLHALDVDLFCVSPKISARARERYWVSATKTASTPTCWPTRCGTNTATGDHFPRRRHCRPSCGRSLGIGRG